MTDEGYHSSLFSHSSFHPFLFFSLSCVFLGFHLYFLLFSLCSLMKKKDLQSSSLSWEQTDNFLIPSSTLEFIATGGAGLLALANCRACLRSRTVCCTQWAVLRALLVQKKQSSAAFHGRANFPLSHFHDGSTDAVVAATLCLQQILPSIPLFIHSIQGLLEGPSFQI